MKSTTQKKEYDQGYKQGFAAGQHEATNIEFENIYEKGLNDAWEAAKIIVNSPVTDHLEDIFNTTYAEDIIPTTQVREAIRKLSIYKEKQKDETEIQVGDEVQISIFTNTYRGVVLRVEDKMGTKLVSVIRDDGFSTFDMRDIKIEKTGRHFPQVAELLEKMKEEYPSEE